MNLCGENDIYTTHLLMGRRPPLPLSPRTSLMALVRAVAFFLFFYIYIFKRNKYLIVEHVAEDHSSTHKGPS